MTGQAILDALPPPAVRLFDKTGFESGTVSAAKRGKRGEEVCDDRVILWDEPELILGEDLFSSWISNLQNPALGDGGVDLPVCWIGQIIPPQRWSFGNWDLNVRRLLTGRKM